MKEIKKGLNNKEMIKFQDEMTHLTIKCKKCNHSVQFLGKRDRIICSWCRNYIYKDDKTEYKYKVQELRRKLK